DAHVIAAVELLERGGHGLRGLQVDGVLGFGAVDGDDLDAIDDVYLDQLGHAGLLLACLWAWVIYKTLGITESYDHRRRGALRWRVFTILRGCGCRGPRATPISPARATRPPAGRFHRRSSGS